MKCYLTLSKWMSQTPNFQAVKEKNEGLASGRRRKGSRGKIDTLLTKEEVEFVDKLLKTRTRLGMNQTQLANVLGTSTGTISAFEQFSLGLKSWRGWLPRLEQWVQDHRENHEERELDKELPEWSIFLEQEQSDCQKVQALENYFKNNWPPRSLSDQEILQIAEEFDLEFKKVKLWFTNKFQRRNHVATKLQEDPFYVGKISAQLKEAIQFARFFREERKRHLCVQDDVAALSGISLNSVRGFELMEMNEGRFLSYHQKLSHWMSNTSNFQMMEGKDRTRKRWQKEEKDYLNQCWDGENLPSKDLIEILADNMGVSKESIYSWFKRQKRKKMMEQLEDDPN